MKIIIPAICCFLLINETSIGQNARDMVKAGGGYNLITLEDVFVPLVYLEYSRVFYPPISLAVSAGFSQAKDITLLFETHDLETIHFDFTMYYSFADNHSAHDVRPGFMLSARSFKTDWRNDTGGSGTDRNFPLGLGFVINYDAHINDVFLLGLKASAGFYNNKSSVYLIGGHVGVLF